MLGLSTVWGAQRTADGIKIVDEAKGLGFDFIELHHSLSIITIKQILTEKEAGKIRICSLHNYCPAVYKTPSRKTDPDIYSLASPYTRERSYAVKHTKRTVDFAKMFDAQAVVLHCGRVEIRPCTLKLIELYESGLEKSRQFEEIKGKCLAKREKKKHRYIEALFKSLDELNEYAVEAGVKLGIENRYYLREIPSFEEIQSILHEFKGGNIYYWHDVGHAQCWEELGVISQEEFLRAYSERMTGMHLHDVFGIHDHKVPLRGDFDFKKLKAYIKKGTIKVIESFGHATNEDMKVGAKFIRDCFGD